MVAGDGESEDKTTELDTWLSKNARLRDRKFLQAKVQCASNLIESVADLRRLHSKDELAEAFPHAAVRFFIKEALDKDLEAVVGRAATAHSNHNKIASKTGQSSNLSLLEITRQFAHTVQEAQLQGYHRDLGISKTEVIVSETVALLCYRCNRQGHIARECPYKDQDSIVRLELRGELRPDMSLPDALDFLHKKIAQVQYWLKPCSLSLHSHIMHVCTYVGGFENVH